MIVAKLFVPLLALVPLAGPLDDDEGGEESPLCSLTSHGAVDGSTLARLSEVIYTCDDDSACTAGGWTRVARWFDLSPETDTAAGLGSARERPAGRLLRTLKRSPPSGFNAAVFEKAGVFVLVFEGTGDIEDWQNNAFNELGEESDYYRKARLFAKRAEEEYGDRLKAVTGHSLGGGLAAWAGWHIKRPAVTFNAASVLGGNAELAMRRWALGNVVSVVVEGEALERLREAGRLGPAVGAQCHVAAAGDDLGAPKDKTPVALHSMRAMRRALGARAERAQMAAEANAGAGRGGWVGGVAGPYTMTYFPRAQAEDYAPGNIHKTAAAKRACGGNPAEATRNESVDCKPKRIDGKMLFKCRRVGEVRCSR
jgi:hypothetical protein